MQKRGFTQWGHIGKKDKDDQAIPLKFIFGAFKWSHRLLIWFALLYWDRVSLSSLGSLRTLCVDQVGLNFIEILHLCLRSAAVKDMVPETCTTKQAVLRTIKVWSYPLITHLWPGFGLTYKIVWKIARTLGNLFMAGKILPLANTLLSAFFRLPTWDS